MKLTVYTDYALRVLLYLTVRQSATVDEVATAYGVSRAHLVKAVHHLGKLGLVHTRRGRGGGIRLARSPEEIRLGEAVRALEPNFHVVECFDAARGRCVLTPVCALKGALREALDAFLATLDRYTLADVAGDPAGLRERLGL